MRQLMALLAGVLLLATGGCANYYVYKTPKPELPGKVYRVKPFTIVVVDNHILNPTNAALKIHPHPFNVDGLYMPGERVIYVRYGFVTNDFTGARLPDLTTLGHEVLHLPEVEGSWHKYPSNDRKR